MSGRIPRARAADRWNPETPGKLSRDLGHAQATIAPGPLPYPTAPGPPGAEGAVRKIFVENVKPYADKIMFDGQGSVIAQHNDATAQPKKGCFAPGGRESDRSCGGKAVQMANA